MPHSARTASPSPLRSPRAAEFRAPGQPAHARDGWSVSNSTRPASTNIVDRLESDGLAKRSPHPSDRRTTLVSLTEAGATRMTEATKALTDIEFGLVGLTERQAQQLSELLERVRRAAGDFD